MIVHPKYRRIGVGFVLVKALEEFDKQSGLMNEYDHTIVDPVMSVFGSLNNPQFDAVKVAGCATNYDLKKASKNPKKIEKVAAMLGKVVAEAFRANPVDLATSLGPVEQASLVESIA